MPENSIFKFLPKLYTLTIPGSKTYSSKILVTLFKCINCKRGWEGRASFPSVGVFIGRVGRASGAEFEMVFLAYF